MTSLFISHSSDDNEAAQRVAERLAAAGISALFLDIHPELGIPAGGDWEREIYRRLQAADAVVFLASRASLASQWCFAELVLARSTGRPVFVLSIEPGVIHPLLRDLQHVDLAAEGDRAFNRLTRALRDAGLDPADSHAWDPARSPYPGLAPFQAADAAVFFGRAAEIDRVLAAMHRSLSRDSRQAVAVLGPSGSGKSSLVRAGVLPRLARSPSAWIVVSPFRPTDGATPLSALARRLAAALGERGLGGWRRLGERLAGSPAALVEAAHDLRDARAAPDARVLLVVDQAEELITRAAPDDAERFLALLDRAAREGSPVWVLLTVRAEFLGAMLHRTALADVATKQVLVPPLDRSRIPEVIEGPARYAGMSFAPGLVPRMVEDTQGGDALPLLAYALRELYDRVADRPVRHVTLEDYEAIGGRYSRVGGVVGALMHRADRLVEDLAAARDTVFTTLLKFVNLDPYNEPTKRRVRESTLRRDELEVVEHFVEQRFLTKIRTPDGEVEIEASHEALLRVWPPLREAVEQARRDLLARSELDRAAGDWSAAGRRPSYLLRGERLKLADRLLDRGLLTAAESPLVLELIRESRRHDADSRRYLSKQVADRVMANLATDPELAILVCLAAVDECGLTAPILLTMNAALDASRVRGRLTGHTAPVLSVAWAPSGDRIVSAAEDGTARVWDVASGRELLRFEGHAGLVGSVAYSPDGARIASASEDGTARIWSAEDGTEHLVFRGHDARVRSVAYDPGGERLVTASEDGSAAIWRARDGAVLARLTGHDGLVLAAAFAPDGASVVTASSDWTVRTWDAASGRALRVLEGHEDWVRSPDYSPDGCLIISASEDGTARIWDAGSGSCVHVIAAHRGRVRGAAFAPDERRALTASGDGTARIWELDEVRRFREFRGLRELIVLRGHADRIRAAAFAPGGRSVATGSEDRTVRIWDVSDHPSRVVAACDTRARHAVLSRDGTRVLVSCDDGTVSLRPAAGGAPPLVLAGHSGRAASARFSPDESLVVTASSDRTARIWDARTGRVRHILRGHDDWVRYAVFDPAGDTVATVSSDTSIAIWSVADGRRLAVLGRHDGHVIAAAFSPDGRLLVTASADRTARIWNVRARRQVGELAGHGDWVRYASFSPDGRSIVTAAEDSTVRVWSASGELRKVIEGHEDWVRTAAYSPDGGRIVTASGDGTVRVWDAAGGEPLHVLHGHAELVGSAFYSSDGRSIVSASHDGTVRIWTDTPVDETIERARKRVFAELGEEVRQEYGLEFLR